MLRPHREPTRVEIEKFNSKQKEILVCYLIMLFKLKAYAYN